MLDVVDVVNLFAGDIGVSRPPKGVESVTLGRPGLAPSHRMMYDRRGFHLA